MSALARLRTTVSNQRGHATNRVEEVENPSHIPCGGLRAAHTGADGGPQFTPLCLQVDTELVTCHLERLNHNQGLKARVEGRTEMSRLVPFFHL